MATTDPTSTRVRVSGGQRTRGDAAETKPFYMTSEFLTLVASVAGVLIAAAVAENYDAPRAWLLATILASAYMISRGLAKAGSRDHSRDYD